MENVLHKAIQSLASDLMARDTKHFAVVSPAFHYDLDAPSDGNKPNGFTILVNLVDTNIVIYTIDIVGNHLSLTVSSDQTAKMDMKEVRGLPGVVMGCMFRQSDDRFGFDLSAPDCFERLFAKIDEFFPRTTE